MRPIKGPPRPASACESGCRQRLRCRQPSETQASSPRLAKLTTPRVTQIMNLLGLAPRISRRSSSSPAAASRPRPRCMLQRQPRAAPTATSNESLCVSQFEHCSGCLTPLRHRCGICNYRHTHEGVLHSRPISSPCGP
jgi:hypothetical protein